MRTAFLLIVAMVVVAAVSYSGIALLNGKYSATPIVNLIGPGDRPSVCAKRSEPYFESNKKILREISGLIIKSDWFTQLWVTDSEDFWKMELIDDEADVYDNVEPTKDDIETFLPLFNQLDIRDFNSPVLFSQSNETVAAIQTASTCGLSIFDWIKFRLNAGGPARNRPTAFAIAYVYWPDGVTDISTCPEPLPKFEGSMLCEIQLSKTWTWSSRWAPNYRLNVVSTETE